jgi:voltage-gated potassium channel
MRPFVRRFVGLIAFFLALTAMGTMGYMGIEGWRFSDALYMTVISITAVGYEEVHQLSRTGQNFTMLLLAGGITGVGIWFALITALIVELDLSHALRERRNKREIHKLRDHVVICGAGRTGRQVMEELVVAGQEFVVIERDQSTIDKIRASIPDVKIIHGDATLDHNLSSAGVEQARAMVAALNADADNLFACLSARHLAPNVLIVARAHEEQSMEKMFRAGADRVVSPNVSSAIQMASFIARPSVMSLLDVATHSLDLSLRLEQARIGRRSSLAGRSLKDAEIPQRTGLIVIAVEKGTEDEREFLFNPVATTVLEPGDELIVLGEPEQVATLRAYAGD